MMEPKSVVQTLQELGITRIEAEVYLATLRESGGGPVSGYRVAQSIGKDPANLSKTLAGLEILGAVRTIQEKPRLYVPVPPEDFTNKLIADMERNRQQVLKDLADLKTNKRQGIPLALNNRKQALNKARNLMAYCRRELLLFADNQTLEMMGTDLEALAASADVSVKLLGIEEFGMPGIQETVIEVPVGFAEPDPWPWLQMVVDRQSWLTASFASDIGSKLPCGWWSEDPALALILGANLAAALHGAASSRPPVATESTPDLAVSSAVSSPEPPVEDEQPDVESPAPESPTQPTEPPSDEEDGDGLQFLIRHDESD